MSAMETALQENFRKYLRSELMERCQRNAHYSRLSEEHIKNNFLDANRVPDYQALGPVQFEAISDWYHYAILEMTRTRIKKPSDKKLAKSLGLTESEVKLAIERLLRANLLKIDDDNNWEDLTLEGLATNISDPMSTNSSRRKLQRQVLDKSLKALDELPNSQRDHTSVTLAMSLEDLEEAKEMIRHFRRKFTEHFEHKSKPKQVVNLHIGFYPVSNSKDEGVSDEN
jgi:uncharacterized protein (TIGR02147 family)